jgi:hypothetical protein
MGSLLHQVAVRRATIIPRFARQLSECLVDYAERGTVRLSERFHQSFCGLREIVVACEEPVVLLNLWIGGQNRPRWKEYVGPLSLPLQSAGTACSHY